MILLVKVWFLWERSGLKKVIMCFLSVLLIVLIRVFLVVVCSLVISLLVSVSVVLLSKVSRMGMIWLIMFWCGFVMLLNSIGL